MTGFEQEWAAGTASADPLRGVPAQSARVDDALVVEVLALLAGAQDPAGVASAALAPLVEVAGVRSAAVVERVGADAVVIGSAGYDCGSMAPGARLPLDSGLPVTEAVRRGRPVVQGSGPSWVALPFGRARTGGLLLSLSIAPPQASADLLRLQRIARGVGDALQRERNRLDAAAQLEVVTARLARPAPVDGGCDAVVRSVPYSGPVGGDSALCVPDGRGGHWLLVADVCGSGVAAAVVGRTVQAAFIALAPYVTDPSELLSAADAAIRSAIGAQSFVTAVAVHAIGGRIEVASAGHPAPLVLTPDAPPFPVVVEPGLPLALDTEPGAERATASLTLPPGAVLLLHTDGVTDRRGPDGPRLVDLPTLVAGLPLDDLDAVADGVLAAADEVGAAGDDASLLLARV